DHRLEHGAPLGIYVKRALIRLERFAVSAQRPQRRAASSQRRYGQRLDLERAGVRFQGARGVVASELDAAQLGVQYRLAGIDLDRAPQKTNGLLRIVLVERNLRELDQRRHVPWIDVDGSQQQGDRFLPLVWMQVANQLRPLDEHP